jgi:serine/threonine protein kinase
VNTGDRLGPYEILALIGAGGMAEVYKARDTRLDRTVAIKICKQQFSERFEREARAVAALNGSGANSELHQIRLVLPVDLRVIPVKQPTQLARCSASLPSVHQVCRS